MDWDEVINGKKDAPLMREGKIILPIKDNAGGDVMPAHEFLRDGMMAAFGGLRHPPYHRCTAGDPADPRRHLLAHSDTGHWRRACTCHHSLFLDTHVLFLGRESRVFSHALAGILCRADYIGVDILPDS